MAAMGSPFLTHQNHLKLATYATLFTALLIVQVITVLNGNVEAAGESSDTGEPSAKTPKAGN